MKPNKTYDPNYYCLSCFHERGYQLPFDNIVGRNRTICDSCGIHADCYLVEDLVAPGSDKVPEYRNGKKK